MISELREMKKRFEMVIEPLVLSEIGCEKCPIKDKCFSEQETAKTDEEFDELDTCEERLWKYINEGV